MPVVLRLSATSAESYQSGIHGQPGSLQGIIGSGGYSQPEQQVGTCEVRVYTASEADPTQILEIRSGSEAVSTIHLHLPVEESLDARRRTANAVEVVAYRGSFVWVIHLSSPNDAVSLLLCLGFARASAAARGLSASDFGRNPFFSPSCVFQDVSVPPPTSHALKTVAQGDTVQVSVTMWVADPLVSHHLPSNPVLVTQGKGVKLHLGTGRVHPGMELGLQGMHKASRRLIAFPLQSSPSSHPMPSQTGLFPPLPHSLSQPSSQPPSPSTCIFLDVSLHRLRSRDATSLAASSDADISSEFSDTLSVADSASSQPISVSRFRPSPNLPPRPVWMPNSSASGTPAPDNTQETTAAAEIPADDSVHRSGDRYRGSMHGARLQGDMSGTVTGACQMNGNGVVMGGESTSEEEAEAQGDARREGEDRGKMAEEAEEEGVGAGKDITSASLVRELIRRLRVVEEKLDDVAHGRQRCHHCDSEGPHQRATAGALQVISERTDSGGSGSYAEERLIEALGDTSHLVDGRMTEVVAREMVSKEGRRSSDEDSSGPDHEGNLVLEGVEGWTESDGDEASSVEQAAIAVISLLLAENRELKRSRNNVRGK